MLSKCAPKALKYSKIHENSPQNAQNRLKYNQIQANTGPLPYSIGPPGPYTIV